MAKPTSHTNWYELPANDLIIQSNTTGQTGHNEPWRNTDTDAASQQIFPPHMTTPTLFLGLNKHLKVEQTQWFTLHLT